MIQNFWLGQYFLDIQYASASSPSLLVFPYLPLSLSFSVSICFSLSLNLSVSPYLFQIIDLSIYPYLSLSPCVSFGNNFIYTISNQTENWVLYVLLPVFIKPNFTNWTFYYRHSVVYTAARLYCLKPGSALSCNNVCRALSPPASPPPPPAPIRLLQFPPTPLQTGLAMPFPLQ